MQRCAAGFTAAAGVGAADLNVIEAAKTAMVIDAVERGTFQIRHSLPSFHTIFRAVLAYAAHRNL